MGCGTVEVGGGITARCAREVTQKSQSVPLLFGEALARWEHEPSHLVMPWHEGCRGNHCVFK